MFELVFLGTAASAPSIKRGLPAQVVMHDDARFIVDCGEGTQRQILRSGLGFRRLNYILLTHGHLDHILGLGGLISTFARWGVVEQITIMGSRWTLERAADLLFRVVLRGARPPMPIELVDIRPGVIWEDETLEVSAFPVTHRGPGCLGYMFRERSRRPFLAEQAAALGVPFGPVRRELVNGKSITLADGRIIHPDDVLGPERPGLAVAILGDLAHTQGLAAAVRGVDVLVCEATYLQRDAELARQHGHLTVREAATLAQEAQVRTLVLTHVSPRYRMAELLDEARALFPESYVAHDFDHYLITRERISVTHVETTEEVIEEGTEIGESETPVLTVE